MGKILIVVQKKIHCCSIFLFAILIILYKCNVGRNLQTLLDAKIFPQLHCLSDTYLNEIPKKISQIKLICVALV